MGASVPHATEPRQSDLDDALAAATAATLIDGAEARLQRADLGALRPLLRLQPGAHIPAWSTRRVTVAFERAGRPIGDLWIYRDLSVRWAAWRAAADVTSPRALGEWLAARGEDAPLRAFERARSPDAPSLLAAWRAAAPPEIAAALDTPGGGPGRAGIDALRAARGDAGAAWALSAWHGARPGPWQDAYPFEDASDAALRTFGVHDLIAAAADGVPPAARAGLARFLVENVTSRGWALDRRLPEPVRASLVDAARASGAEENAVRAARLLIGEGALAPAGSTLVAAASSGSFRRLCTDGARGFAVDGHDLVRMEEGRGATTITKLFKPGTPLAIRGGEVLFLQPGGVQRVPVDGDQVRTGRGPLFGLPARRLPGLLDRFVAEREAALARAVPTAGALLPLDPGDDACAAYEAFGGDLPAAMRQGSFWGADVARGTLHEAPRQGPAREVALGGRPVLLSATETGVLVVVDRDGAAAILAVDPGGAARALGVVQGRAADVRGVVRAGRGAWLRLAAPLGDVVVAADPAA